MIFPLLVIECISPMGSRTWIVHPPRLGWVGFGWSLFLHPYVSLFSSCTVLLISCPCCPLNVARHPRFLPWIWPHGPRSPPSLSLLSQRTLPFYSSFLPSKPPLLSLTPPPLPPECVCERGVAVDRGRRGPPPLPPTNRGASGGGASARWPPIQSHRVVGIFIWNIATTTTTTTWPHPPWLRLRCTTSIPTQNGWVRKPPST